MEVDQTVRTPFGFVVMQKCITADWHAALTTMEWLATPQEHSLQVYADKRKN